MLMDINKIYREDCLVGMQKIPDKSIDMILQDPPYNMTACDFEWDIMTKINEFWAEWKRIIKDKSAIVMTSLQPLTSKLIMSNLKMFKYEWIWIKRKAGNFQLAKIQPLKITENILVFGNGTINYYPIKRRLSQSSIERNRYRREGKTKNLQHMSSGYYRFENNLGDGFGYPLNVIEIGQENNSYHPTQKPVALFEYLICTYTNEGDKVFDGFLGSGTTCVACINTNRDYIGFEIDEHYFNIAQQRIKDAKVQLKLF